ncbi:MAG: tRNA uridine-5-carboxymethylaminomethyl(34) synthesis GTPase MnmE [Pseudomonadota bacterium]
MAASEAVATLETIFARASGAGRAGIAVYRLSGPGSFTLLEKLTGKQATPGRIVRAKLYAPPNIGGDRTSELIDDGLVLSFKAPRSFTGEDVVELHLHGSVAVERRVYEVLSQLGARLAEPGEFTRRALINGKLDLAQTEGLADLIDAETDQQRRLALGQMRGRLSEVTKAWRQQLIDILAPLEAAIDFPDEEDVPSEIAARALPVINELEAALAEFEAASAIGIGIREGIDLALIGPPNAGKSSLLNRLANSERAIVSDEPGTTRDIVDIRLDIAGLPVTLSDTAGVRDETNNVIEQIGMAKTLKKAKASQIRLLVLDVSRETNFGTTPNTDEIESLAIRCGVSRETIDLLEPGDIFLCNKVDLHPHHEELKRGAKDVGGLTIVFVSAETGLGIDTLKELIEDRLRTFDCEGAGALPTRERHVEAVAFARGHLADAREKANVTPEFAAEDVRLAIRALSRITGEVDVEDVLGAIFSSFCIGK